MEIVVIYEYSTTELRWQILTLLVQVTVLSLQIFSAKLLARRPQLRILQIYRGSRVKIVRKNQRQQRRALETFNHNVLPLVTKSEPKLTKKENLTRYPD